MYNVLLLGEVRRAACGLASQLWEPGRAGWSHESLLTYLRPGGVIWGLGYRVETIPAVDGQWSSWAEVDSELGCEF
eukprot:113092-Pelagomonas_calceolata.AAC.2